MERPLIFERLLIVGEGEEFARISLRDLTSGSYPYFRISLSYQILTST